MTNFIYNFIISVNLVSHCILFSVKTNKKILQQVICSLINIDKHFLQVNNVRYLMLFNFGFLTAVAVHVYMLDRPECS